MAENLQISKRDGNVEVSVIIPTKDEGKTIGTCLDKVNRVFEEENINGEIIVVDSSEDSTPEIAKERGSKVVHPDEKGYGNAYLKGMSKVRGKYVIMGDADNTYDFLDIPKLLEPVRKGEADVVVGNRLEGGIKEGAMSLSHRIGQPIMTGLLNLFHRTGVSDAHSGFRTFTREALEEMNLGAGGMDFASELIIEANRKGLRIKEVPIELHPRPEGSEATYSYFSDSWDHLKLILLRAPIKAFTVPGIILLLLGALLLGSSFSVLPNFFLNSATFGALLIIVGVQLFGSGIFTEALMAERGFVDPGGLTRFFSRNFTAGRGFWIGVTLFGIGLALTVISIETSLHQHIISFMLIALGIQIGFVSVLWDLLGE